MPTARLSAAPAFSVGLFLLAAPTTTSPGRGGEHGWQRHGCSASAACDPRDGRVRRLPHAQRPSRAAERGRGTLDLLSLGATGMGGLWCLAARSLGAGEAVAVAVEGAGTGELRVEHGSGSSLLTVPLSATPDEAPEIEVLDPSTNTVLEVVRLLSAAVGDLEDPGAHWSSRGTVSRAGQRDR